MTLRTTRSIPRSLLALVTGLAAIPPAIRELPSVPISCLIFDSCVERWIESTRFASSQNFFATA